MTQVPTRVAVFPPASGAANFALDEALAERAAASGCRLVRVYSWSRPTVSFGRNERVVGRFTAKRFASAGLDSVRRPTGGRALVHHRELTYAVAGPVRPNESTRTRYAETQAVLARALRVLGVDATVALAAGVGTAPSRPTAGAVCFEGAVPGELVVGARKLAAGAQWRFGGAWLQHGSILIQDDQALLAAGLAPGQALPAMPPPATLAETLGHAPTSAEFADALVAALAGDERRAELVSPVDLALDAGPFIGRYLDAEWTWRR